MSRSTTACFFYSKNMTIGSCIELDETESHHLLHVSRTERDTIVTLLNGEGVYAEARLMEVHKKTALLLIESLTIVRKQKPAVCLAVSIPRSESAFEMILKMCAEFGVDRIVPLISANSESYRVVKRAERIERWNKILCNACKQSRTAWFPVLSQPLAMDTLLEGIKGTRTVILAGIEPHYDPLCSVSPATLRDAEEVYWIVGPEGGWTEEEVVRLQAGCMAISFGQSILTSVTASIAGLGVIRFLLRNNLQ